MFDEKTILARLQNGEDAQKIADEMAAMINAANKTYTDQKAAEEAAKKAEAAKTEVQKKKDLQEILDMFATWCATYYNIDEVEFKSELSADQVLDLVNSLNDYVEALKNFESMFSIKPAAKPIGTKVIKSNTKPKSADEQISNFLKKMGW